MSSKPTHRVYTVIPRKDAKGEDDSFWLNIGGGFEHADNGGFNIMLQAMPLDGKLVLRKIKDDEPDDPPPAKKSYSKR